MLNKRLRDFVCVQLATFKGKLVDIPFIQKLAEAVSSTYEHLHMSIGQ